MKKFVFLLILSSWPFYSSGSELQALEVARALFEKRCAVAGERIHKTVKDVDGVLLLKLRPETINYSNQFSLDDPYGRDFSGPDYIVSFLKAHHELPVVMARLGGYAHTPRKQIGYAYVAAINPADGIRHRYTAVVEQPGKTDARYIVDYARVSMTSVPSSDPPPRYGVTFEDISTVEDRKYWIAGSSLKVLDLLSNEVIAERVGYMMDLAQGKTGGGRSPWLIAAHHACPAFDGANPKVPQGGQTDIFVEKVLLPRAESGATLVE